MHISVIYEHEDFIVVNKPIGVSMHSGRNNELGICGILQNQLSVKKLFLVHRLDTPTSGCLLLARTKHAASNLSQLFADRQITKFYIALSHSKPKKKSGKISGYMKKTRLGSYSLSKTDGNKNYPLAVTFFFSSFIEGIGRVFQLKPVTGRTHQLRVSLKSLGSPIIGDTRYKGDLGTRLYLHSHMLVFSYKHTSFKISCLPNQDELFTQTLFTKLPDPSNLVWPKYTLPINNNPSFAKEYES